MGSHPQSDTRIGRDTWVVTASQQVFAPSVPAVPDSICVILNGALQTLPGVYAVDGAGVVTMSETCEAGDTVVLRYTRI